MNKIPQLLTDFRVYLDDSLLVGNADVTLPELAAMSETVKVAGIAGEIEMPVLGQFQSMTCSINWTTIADKSIELASPVSKMITCRGSQQTYNPNTGRTESEQITVVMKLLPKNNALGKLEKATTTDTSNEFEVLMVKVLVDGVEKVLVDKLNYIYRVDGVDYLSAVRTNLGII